MTPPKDNKSKVVFGSDPKFGVMKVVQCPNLGNSAYHDEFLESHELHSKVEVVSQSDFDIEIDFCRELGKYHQVKRFVVTNTESKYAVGVVLDCDGNWVEVHCKSDSNKKPLQSFLEHPLSHIISESNRPRIIFEVQSLQGKTNFENQDDVATAVSALFPSKKVEFNVTQQTPAGVAKKSEDFKESEDAKESDEVKTEKAKKMEAAKFCVYFRSLEDANAFNNSARSQLKINNVTVGPLPSIKENFDEKRLYFIRLDLPDTSQLFVHRTELKLKDEKNISGSDVLRLEYPVVLPRRQATEQVTECNFQLRVAQLQRYAHPVAPGIPELLEASVYFIFYENFRSRGTNTGEWKYAQVISSSRNRFDGHVVIQEIDCNNQRGQLRALKLWLVECKNSDCQNDDCTFFHLNALQSVRPSQRVDDFCPKVRECSSLNCALNHQKPKKGVSTVLSFRILSEPLIFPSENSVVYLKPKLHESSEYFSKGFLRPWLPGRVLGVDIGKQIYKVNLIQSYSETKIVFSTWANASTFGLLCENRVQIHGLFTGKQFESSDQVLVRSCAWISFEPCKFTLAYGCEDGTIRFSHSFGSDGQGIPQRIDPLTGHLGAITCICPITSAEMLESTMRNTLACFASGSADGDVRLWHWQKAKAEGSQWRWYSQVFSSLWLFLQWPSFYVHFCRFFAFTSKE